MAKGQPQKQTNAHQRPRWVAVSGGFDPIHIGHVRMMQAAKKLGDKLVVILNNDNWLRAKKGFVFMPQKERKELIEALAPVDRVVYTKHSKNPKDMSVARELAELRPTVFANGGDRKPGNLRPIEAVVCERIGCKEVLNVGRGGKVQSSSWMIGAARRPASRSVRPWGEYYGWDSGKGWNLKTIYLQPKKRVSLQYHRNREEWWLLVSGDAYAVIHDKKGEHTISLRKGEVLRVEKRQVHRLGSKRGGIVVEVAYGKFNEADIVRLQDDFGRHKKAA
ncbi:adenylyltransferase/cytidyltransferase family protein [Candidatus Kaiserbacteria bacterium]|nr:adenylyltransferase/cytidyltransferase family protein [Candidatus Kaiserbacteria bacterium]